MLESDCTVICPVCAAANTLLIDVTAGTRQTLITDCETCCRALTVRVRLAGESVDDVTVENAE